MNRQSLELAGGFVARPMRTDAFPLTNGIWPMSRTIHVRLCWRLTYASTVHEVGDGRTHEGVHGRDTWKIYLEENGPF